MRELCPMCGGLPAHPRFISWRHDDMNNEFYITVHPGTLAKRCWHSFHGIASEHEHDFNQGPNCSICGLHASTVEGGALSPEVITKALRDGKQVVVTP